MKPTSALLLLLVLISFSLPAMAQKDPLKVQISVFNGASDLSAANSDVMQDPAIRVAIALTNQSGKKIQISKIACAFFDVNGQQIGQDQLQPMELGARANKTAVLFYANLAQLYAFKATGVIEYEANGQTFSVPINVDQSTQKTQPVYNDN